MNVFPRLVELANALALNNDDQQDRIGGCKVYTKLRGLTVLFHREINLELKNISTEILSNRGS